MRVLLVLVGLLVGAFGVLSYVLSTNAIQQATALLIVLIGTVAFVGGAIIDAIGQLPRATK